jgi:hypothetical protein
MYLARHSCMIVVRGGGAPSFGARRFCEWSAHLHIQNSSRPEDWPLAGELPGRVPRNLDTFRAAVWSISRTSADSKIEKYFLTKGTKGS